MPTKVTGCKKDSDGYPIGVAHSNPLLDTRFYEITFSDGHTEEYDANVIAENMYSQVDVDGNRFILLKEIMDHRKDGTAIAVDDKWIWHGVNKSLRCTTQGRQLKVLWCDGTTSWEHLHNLKGSNAIEVAEYAVANKIVEEAAFTWWASHFMPPRFYY